MLFASKSKNTREQQKYKTLYENVIKVLILNEGDLIIGIYDGIALGQRAHVE